MPAVTAGIVKVASMLPEPPEFWCAVSTGTMVRGLQIFYQYYHMIYFKLINEIFIYFFKHQNINKIF